MQCMRSCAFICALSRPLAAKISPPNRGHKWGQASRRVDIPVLHMSKENAGSGGWGSGLRS